MMARRSRRRQHHAQAVGRISIAVTHDTRVSRMCANFHSMNQLFGAARDVIGDRGRGRGDMSIITTFLGNANGQLIQPGAEGSCADLTLVSHGGERPQTHRQTYKGTTLMPVPMRSSLSQHKGPLHLMRPTRKNREVSHQDPQWKRCHTQRQREHEVQMLSPGSPESCSHEW